jgi:energy-coupling factor transporter ATP-binding protein EcfA2
VQRFNIGGDRKTLQPGDADYDDMHGTLYKGEAWQPPGQEIKDGDSVYWVEGIFHAIALWLHGYKVVAGIAAGNYPELFLRPYYGKSITWCLCLDDDKAGRDYMASHSKKLGAKKEQWKMFLTGGKKDWDDLHRDNKITEKFLDDCEYRGRLHNAENITHKAYIYFCKNRMQRTVMDFANRYWSITVETDKLQKDLNGTEGAKEIDLKSESGYELFKAHCSVYTISNCRPVFLYTQQDKTTNERQYFFNVAFPHAGPDVQMAIDGSMTDAPSAFNKALLSNTPGATFDGNAMQLKVLRDRWFDGQLIQVNTVPFVGYYREAALYVFQDFAYQEGKELKLNEQKYFDARQCKIKTTFKGFHVVKSNDFSSDWFENFGKVFGYNGIVALAFWTGSLFAEQIRRDLGLKSFPFLELTGAPGSGKSTLIEFLWKLLGRDDYEGFDPGKASFAGRTRAFSQVANMPVVLIESDRDESGAKKGVFDFEELKTAYNGRAIRATGAFTRGNETEEPPFRGSIVISQNAQVDASEAVLTRIVRCNFTDKHFTPETKALSVFFESAEVEKFSGFLPAALKQEKAYLERFLQHYSRIEKEFTATKQIKNQRVIKCHAMVAAMGHCLPLLFPQFQSHLEQYTNHVFNSAIEGQRRINDDHPYLAQFWEVFDMLNHANDNDGMYKTEKLNHSKDANIIALSLPHVYQEAANKRLELPSQAEIKKLLPGGRVFKHIGIKSTRSVIWDGRNVKCWVFKNHANKVEDAKP